MIRENIASTRNKGKHNQSKLMVTFCLSSLLKLNSTILFLKKRKASQPQGDYIVGN